MFPTPDVNHQPTMGRCSPLLFSSTYSAWCHLSDEMYSRADAHREVSFKFHVCVWSCGGRDLGLLLISDHWEMPFSKKPFWRYGSF